LRGKQRAACEQGRDVLIS